MGPGTLRGIGETKKFREEEKSRKRPKEPSRWDPRQSLTGSYGISMHIRKRCSFLRCFAFIVGKLS